jgi:hypothetical protein
MAKMKEVHCQQEATLVVLLRGSGGLTWHENLFRGCGDRTW